MQRKLFYKDHKNRLYRPRTFINKYTLPRELELVQDDLNWQFRIGLKLFWNTYIHRYMIYREYQNHLVLIGVLDNEALKYREHGEWVLRNMQRGDIFLRGSIDPRKAIEKYIRELDEPSAQEKDRVRRAKEIQEELEKDYDRLQLGRVGILFNKPKQKPAFFRVQDGKFYKLRKKLRGN